MIQCFDLCLYLYIPYNLYLNQYCVTHVVLYFTKCQKGTSITTFSEIEAKMMRLQYRQAFMLML